MRVLICCFRCLEVIFSIGPAGHTKSSAPMCCQAAHAYGPRSSVLEKTIPELPAEIVKVEGKLPKYIEEPSGIAKEKNGSPGLRFWVNTDSGGPPSLWVIDGNNEVLAEVPVAAKNVDWEEVGWTQCRNEFGDKQEALLVADTGNNFGQRNKLKIYMISPIPDIPRDILSDIPTSKKKKEDSPVILPEIIPSKTISFSFPKDYSSDFDSEAFFTYDDRIWILTKRRKESTTGIYRLPTDTLSTCSSSTESKEGEGKKKVEYVGEAESGNPVTAADVSEDQKFLAVLTTSDLLFFNLHAPEAKNIPLQQPIGRVPLDLKQTEGVTWDGPVVVVTNEQRQMFRIKVQLKP